MKRRIDTDTDALRLSATIDNLVVDLQRFGETDVQFLDDGRIKLIHQVDRQSEGRFHVFFKDRDEFLSRVPELVQALERAHGE